MDLENTPAPKLIPMWVNEALEATTPENRAVTLAILALGAIVDQKLDEKGQDKIVKMLHVLASKP